jgi:2-phosphosulfolactate phosphatase
MRRIELALTADAVNPRLVYGTACVVIDVLRASTTIVTALANGCPEIIPVETPEEARTAARARNCLLGGERGGRRIEGFDLGNSPLEYRQERIEGRPIAFTTTNGTRAIRACASADMVLIASFLNAGSILQVLRVQDHDTSIVCAGTRGKPSLEDTVCAGMLLEGLNTRLEAEAVSLWRQHSKNLAQMMKHASAHGRDLMSLGFEKDIDFAARADIYDIVPILENESIVRKQS